MPPNRLVITFNIRPKFEVDIFSCSDTPTLQDVVGQVQEKYKYEGMKMMKDTTSIKPRKRMPTSLHLDERRFNPASRRILGDANVTE